MWPFGKIKRLQADVEHYRKAWYDAEDRAGKLEEEDQKQKAEAKQLARESERRKEEQSQADAYFALEVYPGKQTCWACGQEHSLGGTTVKLISRSITTDFYGGRRYLEVTCSECKANIHKRFVSPKGNEIEPEKEPVENPVKVSPTSSDSRVKEGEDEA